MRRCLSLLLAIGAVAWPLRAQAQPQPYPSRPTTIVVPFAACGGFDVIARIIATRMTELLGQSVIVENLTRAAGIIGVQQVVDAKLDGYTVLFGTVGTHAYNQWIYRKHRYDAVTDLTPVTLFSDQPMVLEARSNLPATNLTEFIALLKQNGPKMQYGTPGAGTNTHLACALLNARIGIDVTHVPYYTAVYVRARTQPSVAT
jgi:tripartite-type tricarboxylate transporter receptor subunit TctC